MKTKWYSNFRNGTIVNGVHLDETSVISEETYERICKGDYDYGTIYQEMEKDRTKYFSERREVRF